MQKNNKSKTDKKKDLFKMLWCNRLCKRFNFSKVAGIKVAGFACSFTKINFPPWVFFTFFKLYKEDQITQSVTFYLR